MDDERTPLLNGGGGGGGDTYPSVSELGDNLEASNFHTQFCNLIGIPSSAGPPTKKQFYNRNSLYERVKQKRNRQQCAYGMTASLSNTLLLSQVVLGAALTALGASESSHVLITIFGVLNTVIAGLVAYLKSRGQPMRSRMYFDDLERVVMEIENSEIMWLGISQGVHGYDEIDVENEVSVRSEVARLTRLYDRAVKNNTQNNPDMYMAGGNQDPITGLRARQGPPGPTGPAAQPVPALPASDPTANAPISVATPAAADPDASPADAIIKPKVEVPAKTEEPAQAVEPAKPEEGESSKGKEKEPEPAMPAPAPVPATPAPAAPAPAEPAADPDSEPATAGKNVAVKRVPKPDAGK